MINEPRKRSTAAKLNQSLNATVSSKLYGMKQRKPSGSLKPNVKAALAWMKSSYEAWAGKGVQS
uniref:Uncharacterized protein n=1 Tax=Romanomermis culicivorax TaxID=13658 RepID=A0A915LAC5_ROMCU